MEVLQSRTLLREVRGAIGGMEVELAILIELKILCMILEGESLQE